MYKEMFGQNAGNKTEPKNVWVKQGAGQPDRKGVQLSDESSPICTTPKGETVGDGFVVVDEEQPSGKWSLGQIFKGMLRPR